MAVLKERKLIDVEGVMREIETRLAGTLKPGNTVPIKLRTEAVALAVALAADLEACSNRNCRLLDKWGDDKTIRVPKKMPDEVAVG